MKLSDVVNRINGNEDRFTTDLEYYVGGEHFDSNELAVTRKGMLKENLNVLGFKFHFAFQKRDVLFMARNPHLRKAGMVMFDGLCSDATYILRSKDENVLLQEYLALQLQSDHFWNYCESHKVGSVNFANNWTSIANYEFDLPPIEEQKVLADKLWAAYKVKESYRQLLSTTDEMLKAKFQEMFGDVEQIALGDKLQTTSGGTPSSKNKTYYEGGTIPWLTSGEVRQGTISSTEAYITESGLENSSAKWVPEGSVVIAMYGATVGSVGILKIPVTTNQAVCSILPNEKFNSTFLYYAIQSKYEWMLSQARGAAQPNISQLIIKQMLIPNPPMELQQQFAEIATQAEATKASLRASIEAIDRVIRSLINQ